MKTSIAVPCPAGEYNGAAGGSCAAVSGGLQVCERGDNHAAVLCRGYVVRAGIDSSVRRVHAGTFAGSAASATCTRCTAGYKCESPGTVTPEICAAGSAAAEGSSTCYGLFGRDVCGYRGKCVVLAVSGWLQVRVECGKNYAIGVSRWIVRGGRDRRLATLCDVGTYQPSSASGSCLACPAGKSCPIRRAQCVPGVRRGHLQRLGSQGCRRCVCEALQRHRPRSAADRGGVRRRMCNVS